MLIILKGLDKIGFGLLCLLNVTHSDKVTLHHNFKVCIWSIRVIAHYTWGSICHMIWLIRKPDKRQIIYFSGCEDDLLLEMEDSCNLLIGYKHKED